MTSRREAYWRLALRRPGILFWSAWYSLLRALGVSDA